ncbi:MAG: helix-turn-helix transcriptional regulator [Rhodospirillales bacterium]|nr:helix-turn-helix transcriptional regulator [Rhodospirillales bacterium]
MTPENKDFGVAETEFQDFGDPAPNSEISERAARLREAVGRAGGNKAVAARSGVPVGTLNNYLAGRDMKVGAMIALAHATHVNLEWLATGRGPRLADDFVPPRAGQPPVGTELPDGTAIAAGPAMPLPPAMPSPADIDRMARALERAGPILEAHQGKLPDRRRFAQLLLLLCNEIAAAEKIPATLKPD